MTSFIVAQLGARMHYGVARVLYEAGVLEHFYTDICATKGWPRGLHYLPERFRTAGIKRLLGRRPKGVPPELITAFTGFGQSYASRRSRARSLSETTGVHLWAGQELCRRIIRQGLRGASSVYTFNSAGLELLCHARNQGLRGFMEQTIAPLRIERELMEAEGAAHPGWESTPPTGRHSDAFIEREQAEWKESDVIICGSDFVREGVAKCGGPVERCVVVPYGVDAFFRAPERRRRAGPLRVVTVGGIGLRKGSPYVLAAAKRLKKIAEFRMVGSNGLQPDALAELRRHVEVTGPVPRTEILRHYGWGDVFLLPSICEGSATVTYEALACGIPVIATPNTGTVVRDGLDGYIVPPSNVDSIVDRLETLVRNPDLLHKMSRNAVERAREFDLDAYGHRLLAVLGTKRSPCPTSEHSI